MAGKNDAVNLSDPAGLAPGDPYASAQDAAVDWQNNYNPQSIRSNKEYLGAVYEKDGRFFSTEGVRKGVTGGSERFTLPKGAKAAEDLHTHGAYSRQNDRGVDVKTTKALDENDSDNLSRDDIDDSNSRGRPMMIGTPSGDYKEYNPSTGMITTIKPYTPTIAPSKKSSETECSIKSESC